MTTFPDAARPRRIWLFNPYGPLPDEGWRDYSYVMIGEALAAAGHEVVWWTSNFSHHFKKFRSDGWEDRTLSSGLTLRLVPTPGYRRNIGLGRFWRDAVFGWRSYRRARSMAAPDVIITSEPATMGGFAGVRLATKNGAALIYDQMDLWPELMVQALPKSLRWLGQIVAWPVYRYRRSMFRKLDGAMALAQPYLASITNALPDNQAMPTLIVYNGIDVPAFREAMRKPLPSSLTEMFKKPGEKAIFAGSLGPSYDVGAMIGAAQALEAAGSDTTIFIAGDGPERDRVARAATACANLIYLGKLAPDILPAVYAHCNIGLACYSAQSNVEMCDKFYDYTAAGLVIVNSLQGEVSNWIRKKQLGLQYTPGSAASLARVINRITQNPDEAAAWRAASWQIGMRFDRTVQHAHLPEWINTVLQHSL